MLKLYSSSAGSGKTYTLTREYLKIALSEPDSNAFRRILAVTFTNAAAREMKERIIGTLKIFSNEQAAAGHPMFVEILDDYPHKAATLINRSREVLSRILHQYSDFSVVTIDSFMARLLSTFTNDLGLPLNFETSLDNSLLYKAVDQLLAKIGAESETLLTETLENYYLDASAEGKGWVSLQGSIKSIARLLLSDEGYIALEKLEELDMADFRKIRRQILDFILELEKRIFALAGQAMNLLGDESLYGNDFYQGSRGIYAYFNARALNVSDIWNSPNSYVIETIKENKWASKNADAATKEKIIDLSDHLRSLYFAIEDLREKNVQQVKLLRLLERKLYSLSLLSQIKQEFDQLLRQHRKVHISEFNQRVLQIVSGDPVPFIFERLGNKFSHILIDEFQDTSAIQFANLLPLIDNSLAFGQFNLIVGDAKQAVYRFRGGDMDLILKLSAGRSQELMGTLGNNPFLREQLDTLNRNIKLDHLRINRRSAAEITAFNNRFFEFLAQKFSDNSPLVQAVFDEHFPQEISPESLRGGHVEIDFLDTSNDEPTAMLERVKEILAEVRAKGFHWRDTAILCRKKEHAGQLSDGLHVMGYPIISDDSLLVGKSQLVQFLIKFVRAIYEPADAADWVELATLFHRIAQGRMPHSAELDSMKTFVEKPRLESLLSYFNNFEVTINEFDLRRLGVYELVEFLIRNFALSDQQNENDYLFRFLDEVLRFSTEHSNHPVDFLTWWKDREADVSVSADPNTDAIRVTTIHRSKGLEYPCVLVPFASWSFEPTQNSFIWGDLSNLGYEELSIETHDEIKKTLKSGLFPVIGELSETALRTEYREELNKTLAENMNLLYVAFTRAIQALYVITKEDKWANKAKGIHFWLHDFVTTFGVPGEEENKFIVDRLHGEPRHSKMQYESSSLVINRPISGNKLSTLRLRRQADRIFDVDTFEKRKDWGQKLKYALASMRHGGEFPETIENLKTDGIISGAEGEKLKESFNGLMTHEFFYRFFNKEAQVIFRREVFLTDGTTLAADRTVTYGDGSIWLMNFVANLQNSPGSTEMRKLMRAYKDLGFSGVNGFLCNLENDEIVKVKEK